MEPCAARRGAPPPRASPKAGSRNNAHPTDIGTGWVVELNERVLQLQAEMASFRRAGTADVGTSWVVDLQRRVQAHDVQLLAAERERAKDAETVVCLMDLVEDTMPTADVHALVVQMQNEVAASTNGWRTALAQLEATVLALDDRVQSLEHSRAAGEQARGAAVTPVPAPAPAPASPLGVAPSLGDTAALRQLAQAMQAMDRRLEMASGNISDINIRLMGTPSADAAGSSRLDASQVEERLRSVEVTVERTVVQVERRAESICRAELALARSEWGEGGAGTPGVSVRRHGDSALVARVDGIEQGQQGFAGEIRKLGSEMKRLDESSSTNAARVEAVAVDVAGVEARKNMRADAQADELTACRAALTRLEQRVLSVAEEAGDGVVEARRWCTDECNRLAAANLDTLNDHMDQKLTRYTSVDELESVRQLVHTSAKLSAAGKSALAGRFVDDEPGGGGVGGTEAGGLGEYDGQQAALARAAMREEVRRCTGELQSQATGLTQELRDVVYGATRNVAQLQSRLEDNVSELRAAGHTLASQVAALDRRIASTVEPLAAKVTSMGTSQREMWDELRERSASQVEALRIDTEGRLQAQENEARRMARELTSMVTEQRRSVDDVVHEIGTRGEIARSHLREAMREELEATRLNCQNELRDALRQVKQEGNDKMEVLRASWLERDSETVHAISSLQRSVETRLLALEGGTDERFSGLRVEMGENMTAMEAASADHRERAEIQLEEARRVLRSEMGAATHDSGWATAAQVEALSNHLVSRVTSCEGAAERAKSSMETALADEVTRLLQLQDSHSAVIKSVGEERSERLATEVLDKMRERCEELERQIEQDRRLGRAASQMLREEVELMLERAQRGQPLEPAAQPPPPPPLKQAPVSAPKPTAWTGPPAPRGPPGHKTPLLATDADTTLSRVPAARASSPALRAGSPRKVYHKEDLQGFNPMKLKAAAKAASVPPVPMGKPARTKDETIAAILEVASANAAAQ